MLSLCFLLSAQAAEWRADGGAQIDSDSHGIVDFALRWKTWQLGLYTDTLELRWQPEGEHGRAWLALRGEAGAAELLISPWRDGAPAPERALTAFYGGLEGGIVRYLPKGFYAGAEGRARVYGFIEPASSDGALTAGGDIVAACVSHDTGPLVGAWAFLGYWSQPVQGWLRGGGSYVSQDHCDPLQSGLALELVAKPDWRVAPRLEIRAGLGWDQGYLTRTRLGGLNPYVVPLAGAAWAEWWVEDYLALRGGPTVQAGPVELAALVDAAWFDHQEAVGFALSTKTEWRRLFLDLDGGVAPWILRQEGVGRWSIYFRVGTRWGRGDPLAREEEPRSAE